MIDTESVIEAVELFSRLTQKYGVEVKGEDVEKMMSMLWDAYEEGRQSMQSEVLGKWLELEAVVKGYKS